MNRPNLKLKSQHKYLLPAVEKKGSVSERERERERECGKIPEERCTSATLVMLTLIHARMGNSTHPPRMSVASYLVKFQNLHNATTVLPLGD